MGKTYSTSRRKEKAMSTAIASNVVKCQVGARGSPVDALVVVFEDGSTKVLCPSEKGCKPIGPCNYELSMEKPAATDRGMATAKADEETDPIGSAQRHENPPGFALDPPQLRDPVGSMDRFDEVHEMSDADIFN